MHKHILKSIAILMSLIIIQQQASAEVMASIINNTNRILELSCDDEDVTLHPGEDHFIGFYEHPRYYGHRNNISLGIDIRYNVVTYAVPTLSRIAAQLLNDNDAMHLPDFFKTIMYSDKSINQPPAVKSNLRKTKHLNANYSLGRYTGMETELNFYIEEPNGDENFTFTVREEDVHDSTESD